MTSDALLEQAAALADEIAQLQSQWPKHSTPPALVIQLEDLEEALAQVHAAIAASASGRSARSAPTA